MIDKFTVRCDRSKRRLCWTMHGFWELGDVAAFGAAMRDAAAPLGAHPVHVDGLADARDFPVQSADVAEALGRFDRDNAAARVGRVAIVVGSVINKLQAKRALNPAVRIFTTLDEAEAWLDGGEQEPSS